MRFASSFLDELRDRITLSSVVGRRVQWDRKKTNPGKGDYWACCPFHGEKSPSFHVEDRKGRYHCFGCGVTGDVFRFLTKCDGLDFIEAVKEAASLAGVSLPEETAETRQKAARRLGLIEANDKAMAWYQARLQESPDVLAYVAKRGISPAEAARFKLGYAPAGNRLRAAELGIASSMVEAGLLAQRDDGSVYDRFQNRLMFPILDAKGHAIAFSGRALSDDQAAKYLNSPETPIWEKGAVLFNGPAARAAAWEGAQFVLVEGNVDVIAACRAGFAAAAPLGTAMTEQHVTQMIKATDSAVLCFDGDAAGRKAAERAIDLILPVVGPNFTARFALLPEGQDPDSMVRRNPQAFAQIIANAVTLEDMLWSRETRGIAAGVPEQRAKLEQALRAALGKIADRDTKRAYGANIRDRLQSLGKRPSMFRSNSYSQHSTSPGASRLMNNFQRAAGLPLKDAIIVAAIVSAPALAQDMAESLVSYDRLSPDAVELVSKLVGAMTMTPDAAIAEVLEAAGLTDIVDDALVKANAAGVALELGRETDVARSVLDGMKTRH